jgi:hypothetical protein
VRAARALKDARKAARKAARRGVGTGAAATDLSPAATADTIAGLMALVRSGQLSGEWPASSMSALFRFSSGSEQTVQGGEQAGQGEWPAPRLDRPHTAQPHFTARRYKLSHQQRNGQGQGHGHGHGHDHGQQRDDQQGHQQGHQQHSQQDDQQDNQD